MYAIRSYYGAIQAAADDVVGALVGVRDPATALLRVLHHGTDERHHRFGVVPPLLLEPGKVHTAGIDPRRGTGFKSFHPEGQLSQTPGEGA